MNLNFRTHWHYWVVGLALLAGAYAFATGKIKLSDLSPAGKAYAADKGGPRAAAAATETETSWTGWGVGLRAGIGQGAADFGGPVNVDINGQTAGAMLFARQQFGSIVLGVDGGYDRVWGDLHSFGINNLYTVGASIGVTPTKNSLLYTRAEWLRAQGSGGHIDGWGLGGGIEVKIANSPLTISLDYVHDWMDKDMFGPGVDVTADRVMLIGKWQFGGRPSLFADR